MKLFTTILLASIAYTTSTASTAIEGRQLGWEGTASELETRWFMTEPDIEYDPVDNIFTLNWPDSSPLILASEGGMAETFFDYNCKYDGDTDPEFIIPPGGITGPDGFSAPEMTNDGIGGTPQMIFKVNTAILTQYENIYEIVTPT